MTERNPSPVNTSVLMRYDLRLPSGFQITPVNHAGCNTAMLSVSQCKRLYALGKTVLYFSVFSLKIRKVNRYALATHL